VAATILAGFERYWQRFREISAGAKARFERADWAAGRQANRERIDLYDANVRHTVAGLTERVPAARTDETLWPRVKQAYIALLYDHKQPELAETFYNSVACRVLDRTYYRNEIALTHRETGLTHRLALRPVVSTDNLFALRSALGIVACLECVCDVNDSGAIRATDALAVLRKAVMKVAGGDAFKKWSDGVGFQPTNYGAEKTWAVVNNLEKIFKGLAPSLKAAKAKEKAEKK